MMWWADAHLVNAVRRSFSVVKDKKSLSAS